MRSLVISFFAQIASSALCYLKTVFILANPNREFFYVYYHYSYYKT